MCGDSTDAAQVARLAGGEVAQLLHADPPYGMGKEADGVVNDSLTGAALDAFQMAWWRAYRPHLTDLASAYIWGNAAELWRLWYVGGLAASETIELRNEIVWDKKHIPGMASPLLTQYPVASERCLFLQLGDQRRGNINSDAVWAGWLPIIEYLAGQAAAVGLTSARCHELTGVQMFPRWFTASQWSLMAERHYETLREVHPRAFRIPHAVLKAAVDALRAEFTRTQRAHFDNAAEVMRDVWEYPRVVGDERHGHATPKPVDMMSRVMRASLPAGGLCLEPFGGTGSTLIAAERTGRRCYTMEITPDYVEVILSRWEKETRRTATRLA